MPSKPRNTIGRCEICRGYLYPGDQLYHRVTPIGDLYRWHTRCDHLHPINRRSA